MSKKAKAKYNAVLRALWRIDDASGSAQDAIGSIEPQWPWAPPPTASEVARARKKYVKAIARLTALLAELPDDLG